jgi:metal-sulfur cluster biosynthetic enzyme
MITEEIIREALRNVYDPEIDINVQDLGLIYTVEVDGDAVEVNHTLTSVVCPFADQICEDIEDAVASVEGVNKVKRNLVFDPPFSIDMVPEETKIIMGWF